MPVGLAVSICVFYTSRMISTRRRAGRAADRSQTAACARPTHRHNLGDGAAPRASDASNIVSSPSEHEVKLLTSHFCTKTVRELRGLFNLV